VDACSLTKASASNSRQRRQTDDRRVPKRGLVNRVRRFCGQVDAIERALDGEASCSDLLQRITAARGAINGLMTEVLSGSSYVS
jgi:DNA-binding FrmR family transcriptional regulator